MHCFRVSGVIIAIIITLFLSGCMGDDSEMKTYQVHLEELGVLGTHLLGSLTNSEQISGDPDQPVYFWAKGEPGIDQIVVFRWEDGTGRVQTSELLRRKFRRKLDNPDQLFTVRFHYCSIFLKQERKTLFSHMTENLNFWLDGNGKGGFLTSVEYTVPDTYVENGGFQP